MNKLSMVGGVFVICLAGETLASSCSDSQVTGADLVNLISGNTVCATFDGDRWQEQHRAGGALWDYKKGPSDPVDPTKRVGDWAIIPNRNGVEEIVRYSYPQSYQYTVHGTGVVGTLHSFCGSFDGGVDIDNALLLNGSVSCP